jgi:leader peptidase (prepilin peptidase) / N-methyltransferase
LTTNVIHQTCPPNPRLSAADSGTLERDTSDTAADGETVTLSWIIAGAVAGLVAGWGLRVVIVRYAVPAGEPPRRRCPACPELSAARGWALAPSGRCPGCGQRTGPPPLAVEVTTAVLLGALAARVHPGLVLAAACWLALCAVPLAFIDGAVRRLPDVLTGPAFAGTVVLLLAAAAADGDWHVLARAVLGALALSGFYLVLVLVSPSGMGMGDVKAAAGLGTMLAWLGWGALIAGGFAGFLFAALYGTALLISGRAMRKQQIAFGPFMITGAFLAILAWHLSPGLGRTLPYGGRCAIAPLPMAVDVPLVPLFGGLCVIERLRKVADVTSSSTGKHAGAAPVAR